MSEAVFRSRARLDVLEQHDWYVAQEAHGAAERFIDAVAETVAILLDAPAAGRLESFEHPRLAEVRSIGVSGFSAVRLYYFRTLGGIEVIRVLHTTQDVLRIMRREGQGPEVRSRADLDRP